MIPKKNRISRVLFTETMKNGVSFSCGLIRAKALVLQGQNAKNECLFSFVAPKSVAKLAVDRNKLRRQGYSVIQNSQYLQGNFTKKPFSLAFFYSKGSKNMKYEEIESSVNEILKNVLNRINA